MTYRAISHHRHEPLLPLCVKRCTLLFAVALFAGAQGLWTASAQEVLAVKETAKSAVAPTATQVEVAQPTQGRYRIGVGDVLDIRVLNRPQLSREAVRLDERGTIRMPWIDKEVQAICRTERELAENLASLYRRFLRNPQVDVFIKEYQSNPVAVIGAVNSPGRFQLQRRLRLLELLTYVNGPAERAGRTIQIVHADDSPACESGDRTVDSEAAAIETAAEGASDEEANDVTSIALGAVLRGDREANPYIRAGDTVTVLEAEQVFVIGNVIKPTQIPLRDTITLSQAMAMAGGLAPDAKSDKVRVIRQSPDGKKNILFFDLKAIDKGQANDVALQANDIVDIPSSNTRGKQIGKAILSSFFPSVGSLPVRVIR